MASLDQYLDAQLSRGRIHVTSEEALAALDLTPAALTAAITRLIKKHRLANPRHGFYLILRPEDRITGAPDPARWINPLMKHQGIDYRIALLRAAAFHGSSHQAAMVFQVIVPKQLRGFEIGRHRVQFLFQNPATFEKVNQPAWLDALKSDTGFARVAGVELTLLDCARYFRKVGGINALAQVVRDVGANAGVRKLAQVAAAYENATVRRLGFLLERAGHLRQARALEVFATKAKSFKPLDPAVKSLIASRAAAHEKNAKWMLEINQPVEIDF